MVTAGRAAEFGDESISEVEAAAARGDCGSDDRFAVGPELPGVEETLDEIGTASSADLVGASQDPVELPAVQSR